MAVIYLSNQAVEGFALGNDANAGTFAAPKLTLANAYSTAVDGDTICFLTPNGRWFESISLGYLYFTKVSLSAGIDFISYDPRRPAKIGGVSSTYSVRCDTSFHRFHNIDIVSGSASNTTIFGCSVNTAATDIVLKNCRIIANHDISSTSAYLLAQYGTADHLRWSIEDCELIDNCRYINGIYANYSNFRLLRTKVNLKRAVGGYALRIGTAATDVHVEACELDGDYGIAQIGAMTVNSQVRIIDSKIRGKTYAALFNGGGASATLRLHVRDTDSRGETNGFVVSGSYVEVDSARHKSLSGNIAMAYPNDGAYTNVTARVVDGITSAWHSSTGHSILFANGALNPVLINHHSTANSSPYAAVIKGTGGKIYGGRFDGGTAQTLLFKGAINWTLRDVTARQSAGGSTIEIRNGDTTPVSSGMDIQGCQFLVTNGSLFNIGAITTQEDGTSIVDHNAYEVSGSGTWGSIRGTSVASLDAVRSAWTGVTTNDDNSYEITPDLMLYPAEELERARATSSRTQVV
jgi:hypothetical protein